MNFLIPPTWTFAGLCVPLAVIAGLSTLTALNFSPGERRQRWSVYASLLAGLAGATLVLMAFGESFMRSVDRTLWRLWVDSGHPLAVAAALAAPFAASRLERAAKSRAAFTYEIAGHPGWMAVAVFGLVTSVHAPGIWSWVVFAPAVLVPLVFAEALFASPVPWMTPVPATVPAPRPSLRPSQIQLSLGQVELRVASCPVCRDDVRDGARACARCKTPHHAECFDFNGRCAIFGCASFAAEPLAKV